MHFQKFLNSLFEGDQVVISIIEDNQGEDDHYVTISIKPKDGVGLCHCVGYSGELDHMGRLLRDMLEKQERQENA